MIEFFASLNKRVIVFGTGTAAKKMVGKSGLEVDYYVDNDSEKWETFFLSRKVKAPILLSYERKEEIVILVASMYYDDIKMQLESMGYEEYSEFYNFAGFFVNPFESDEFEISPQRVLDIHKLISKYIDMGHYSDASKLLHEYADYNPFDEKVKFLEILIALQKGDIDKARNMAGKGIEGADTNFEAYLNFNKVQRMINNKDYLKALEAYEKVLMETCDNGVTKYIYNALNKLESEYCMQICDQLDKYSRKECKDHKSYNLHLMFDHFHNKSFIEFINKFYPENTNIFLVFYFGDRPNHIADSFYSNIYPVRITGEDALYIMQGSVGKFIKDSKAVFIHYLHDMFCELVIKSEIKNKLIYWILWGGDIYSYARDINLYDAMTSNLLTDMGYNGLITFNKDYELQRTNIYRRAAIRKISYVLTWIRGDYEVLKSNFITSAERLDYIFPNPVNFNMIDESKSDYSEYDLKNKYNNVIMLGNSADPSNNHIEIMHHLNNFRNKSFCVILTLSYGNSEYTKKIIEIGKELLGDKFIPITEYIEPRKYCMLLRQVDVAIMNHNRQQGVGNILALLYLGKKVFIKGNVAPYRLLKEIGIEIYNEKDLFISTFEELIEFDMNSKLENRRIVYENFNEARIKQCADLIFGC